MVELFRGRKWDLVGHRRWWFTISGVTIVVGLYFWIHHGLNFGIDFTGGGLLTYKLPKPIPLGEQVQALATVRQELSRLGYEGEVNIAGSTFGSKDQVLVRTKINPKMPEREKADEVSRQAKRLEEALQKDFAGISIVGQDMVGAVVSEELIRNAIIAVVLGMVLVVVWISIRYDFKYATCAIIALGHDCLVLTGMFALLYREVNAPFVAALLTMVGYSVHDTIVIFDRIRENVKLRKGHTFGETVNTSLLETMARSVNTVLTVLITVTALFFLGGPTIHVFSLAMLIGVITGAYSSIFNAGQLLVVWKEWGTKPTSRAAEARVTRLEAPAAPPGSAAGRPRATGIVAPATSHGEAAASAAVGSPAGDATKRKLKAKKRKRRY